MKELFLLDPKRRFNINIYIFNIYFKIPFCTLYIRQTGGHLPAINGKRFNMYIYILQNSSCRYLRQEATCQKWRKKEIRLSDSFGI